VDSKDHGWKSRNKKDKGAANRLTIMAHRSRSRRLDLGQRQPSQDCPRGGSLPWRSEPKTGHTNYPTNPAKSGRLHPTQSDSVGGSKASATLIAAYTPAFAGFLRCGSFTYDAFDPAFNLARSNLHLESDTSYVYLPADKTDAFRHGVEVYLPVGAPGDLCPTRALRYLTSNWPGDPKAPLFSLSPTQPLFPRSIVIDKHLATAMRGVRVQGKVTGHSFRRGAATWASSVGYTAEEIKMLGRWNSDCFRCYVDTTASRKRDVAGGQFTRPSVLPAHGFVLPSLVFDPDA